MPALWQELPKQFSVSLLQSLRLGRRDFPPQLTRHRAGEQASAHPDTPVNAPAVDREPHLRQGSLPGEHVRVDRVDERSVEIEDECRHHRRSTSLVMSC